MPSWNDLVNEFQAQPDDPARSVWLNNRHAQALTDLSRLRGGRNVLVYSSAFLQKPQVPPQYIQIVHEDLNGFMSVIFGMDWSKGLTLVLHTPGGVTNATETIVAYLRSKFSEIEVIVPTFAMSAGTMISLASDAIVMGRQSQLGPIDPQMPMGGRYVSARAIVDQFNTAKDDILKDLNTAHVWAPVLQSVGPALLQEAQNALDYGESMVARWLADYMFRTEPNRAALGEAVAKHFNDASVHKSHGRRIDRDEARAQGLNIEDLENDQLLQDAVLTSYHLSTIVFEHSPAVKVITSNHRRTWLKNWLPPNVPPQSPP